MLREEQNPSSGRLETLLQARFRSQPPARCDAPLTSLPNPPNLS